MNKSTLQKHVEEKIQRGESILVHFRWTDKPGLYGYQMKTIIGYDKVISRTNGCGYCKASTAVQEVMQAVYDAKGNKEGYASNSDRLLYFVDKLSEWGLIAVYLSHNPWGIGELGNTLFIGTKEQLREEFQELREAFC